MPISPDDVKVGRFYMLKGFERAVQVIALRLEGSITMAAYRNQSQTVGHSVSFSSGTSSSETTGESSTITIGYSLGKTASGENENVFDYLGVDRTDWSPEKSSSEGRSNSLNWSQGTNVSSSTSRSVTRGTSESELPLDDFAAMIEREAS